MENGNNQAVLNEIKRRATIWKAKNKMRITNQIPQRKEGTTNNLSEVNDFIITVSDKQNLAMY